MPSVREVQNSGGGNWPLVGKAAVAAVSGVNSPGDEPEKKDMDTSSSHHSTREARPGGGAYSRSLAVCLENNASCFFTSVTQLWRLPFISGWIFSACLLTFHFGLNSTLSQTKCGSAGRADHSGNESLTLHWIYFHVSLYFHLLHDNTAFQ